MNICLDTRLLEEIASKNEKQREWLIETYTDPSNHIFLPLIALTEFISQSLKKRNEADTNAVVNSFVALNKSAIRFSMAGMNTEIAKEAGKIQYMHHFGIGDSIIIATARHCKCKFIRTDQKEFEKVKKTKTQF